MLEPVAGVARVKEWVEVQVAKVLDLGLGAACWVAVLSAAIGVGLVFSWPGLASVVHAKYGSGIVVASSLVLGFAVCLLVARALSPTRLPEGFARVALAYRRYGSWLLLVVLAITLGRGLERNNPFVVLALAVTSAWVAGRWAWAWMPAVRSDSVTAPSPWPARLLGVLIGGYTLALSTLSINNHLAFNTGRADLGFYVSIFRRSSLGDFLGCTICGGGNHLSGHFDPILVALSPLYLIYPEAETVLVLQSLLLGVTMLPLFWLSLHYGLGSWAALAVCACFGLHPALHGINLFDFHSLALVVPGAVWLLWARDTGRTRTYWALLLVFLSIREDAALIAIVIGADGVLNRRRFGAWQGLVTLLLGATYFVIIKTFVLSGGDPLNPGTGRGYAYYYQDLVPKGTGTLGLVNTVLGNPAKVLPFLLEEGKVLYWLQLLVPVMLLPLVAQRGRLLLVYGLAFTLLASRVHVYSLHFHYSSVALPFIFYLLVVALSRPKRLSRHVGRFLGVRPLPRQAVTLALIACLGSSLVVSWRFGGLLPNRSFRAGFKALDRSPTESDLKRDQILKSVCRDIPKGATVAASEPHLPHLGRCAGYYGKSRRYRADYLIWSFPRGSETNEIRAEMRKGYWKEVKSYGKFKLLKANYPKDYVPKKRGRRPKARFEPPQRVREPASATTLPVRKPAPATNVDADAGVRPDAGP